MKRALSLMLVILVFAAGCGLNAAAAPDSFSHSVSADGLVDSYAAREMYVPSKKINAAALGLTESLQGLTDICCGTDGKIYLLCGDNSRLVILNSDYTFNKELILTDKNGKVNFTGAKGIFVNQDNTIYIADTKNARVVVANPDGAVREIREAPQSSLIPADFVYAPVSISIDKKGYVYILSLGCFYGALAYKPDGTFMGFYGANKVNASALDVLGTIWNKLTKNDAKRAASLKTMPYAFVDLTLDNEGYLITCTGKTEEKITSGQIRKISPDGQDILNKRGADGNSASSANVNFFESGLNSRQGFQNMCSLSVDSEGFMYGLDDNYGLIYVYDSECNMVNGFGGGVKTGNQLGTFHTPVSLTVSGNSILVADSYNCSVTVFELTPYGALLKQAYSMYIKGDYSEAEPLWRQVLKNDRNNQSAYRGLAMASYSVGDYKNALEFAKSGMDDTAYDLAWQATVKGYVADNFIWISALILCFCGGLIYLFVVIKKRKTVLVTNAKAKTLLSVTFHPFRSFEELKYKNTGSLTAAAVLLFLLYFGTALSATASGFLFTDVEPKNYNMLYTLAQTIGLVLLWSLSNWLVCSLFSGNGRLHEVFTATVYSLIPLIIYTYIRLILSHVLAASGVSFMAAVGTIVWIYTFFLLCIAMMTVHDYDFFKLLLTAVGVIFLMIMIVFVLFMFIMLFRQVVDFVYNIYDEIAFR